VSESPSPETVRVKQRSSSPWRNLIAGVAAVAAFATTVVLTLAKDVGSLPPVWRTGLAASGVCVATLSSLWGFRRNWFKPLVRVVCAGATVLIVAGAMVFLTPKPPTAPERLLGFPASDSVRLEWPRSADDHAVRTYEVYRGRGKERVTVCSGRQTFCVDSNVRAGQVYDYFVVAVGDGGKSIEISYSVKTWTVDPRLKPPSLVKAQVVVPHSVLLTWTAPEGAADDVAYEVIRDGGKVADVAATDFVDDEVLPGASYTFTIRSFNRSSNAESPDSMPVTVSVPEVPSPDPALSPAHTTRPPPPPTTKTTAPAPASPPPPACSSDLTRGGWRLATTDDADEASDATPDNVLQGRTYARIKFDLHGLDARTGGDDGVVIFNQDNDWFTANLAVWGVNGKDGVQTVTIPTGEFRRVSNGDPIDTNADVSGVRARFWHEGSWVVDIYSIVVCK
jgi:hypothetical protein